MKQVLGLLAAVFLLCSATTSAQAQRNCDDPCAPGCSLAGTPACSSGSMRQGSSQGGGGGSQGGGSGSYTAPRDGSGGSGSYQRTTDGDLFTFRVCNRSDNKASVALSYRNENNKWIVQGWWTVNVDECRNLGSFRKGYFYYYAKHYSGSGEWRGSFKLCVKIPNAFKRINRKGYTCPNRLLKRFVEKQVKTDRYTWTLRGANSGSGSRAGGGNHFTFRVCNKSRKKASVALSYRNENNKWVVQGWWTVQVGECRRIGTFRKGYFYYYAKNYSGSGEWRGKFKLCVKIPEAFKRINRKGYKCERRLLKRFIEKQVKTDKYTWNLLK